MILGKTRIMITFLVATLFENKFEDFIKEVLFEYESECSKKKNIYISERLEFVSLIKETDFLIQSKQFDIIQDQTDNFIIKWIQVKRLDIKDWKDWKDRMNMKFNDMKKFVKAQLRNWLKRCITMEKKKIIATKI